MKYRAIVQLPSNLGIIEIEDENEQSFLKNLERIPAIKEKAVFILSAQGFTTETGQYPNIAKPRSVPDAIEKLLATNGGRKMPRPLHWIHSALDINAVFVSKEALGATLTKMTKANRLSRVKRNGVYAYTLPLQRRA